MTRPITHRSILVLPILLISFLLVACGGGDGRSTTDDSDDMAGMEEPFTPTEVIEFEFMTHAAAGMAEQDVFLAGEAPGEVFRPTAEESLDAALASLPVYRTAVSVDHDPFGLSESPLGPFEQGEDAGFTLGEWMSATGSGRYATDGERGRLELDFENLVADGVYTIWCAEINMPPDFSVIDRPCGAPDGSESVFTADAEGDGSITIPLDAMPESREGMMAAIAAAYHSDGQDHGPVPGPFGSDTHVQLMYMVPMAETAEASTETEVVELSFASFTAGGTNEQDVYVAGEAPGTVVRVTPEEAADPAVAQLAVFNSSEPVARDPRAESENPLGPFPMGEPLNVTLGEWLGATAEGSFTTDGERGELALGFDGLVPDGLYTLWCVQSAKPNDAGLKSRVAPCGAPDGSESSFTADASGDASVRLELDALPQTTEDYVGVIAVAYHSDDRTYGEKPGDFGSVTHVQLMHRVVAQDSVAAAERFD